MNYRYAIFFTGAPYGDNEAGHIVSRHRSLWLAQQAFDRLFSGTTGIYDNSIKKI